MSDSTYGHTSINVTHINCHGSLQKKKPESWFGSQNMNFTPLFGSNQSVLVEGRVDGIMESVSYQKYGVPGKCVSNAIMGLLSRDMHDSRTASQACVVLITTRLLNEAHEETILISTSYILTCIEKRAPAGYVEMTKN